MPLGLGPTDLVAIFTTIFADVATTRAARGLPPLVSAHLGQEQKRTEESPPRIVVVPTHNVYEYARIMGTQPPTGTIDAQNPRCFATRLMHFEAHLWGNETPTPSSPPIETDLWYQLQLDDRARTGVPGLAHAQLGQRHQPAHGAERPHLRFHVAAANGHDPSRVAFSCYRSQSEHQ